MFKILRSVLSQRFEQTAHTYRIAQLSGGLSAATALAGVIGLLYVLQRHLSQQKLATEMIGQQAERLRVTLACIGDAVLTTDVEGRITNLNGVAEKLMGWPLADAKGKPLEEVFRIVNETSRQPVENPAARALREGNIVGLANHTLLIARDGSELPIDDSAAPIRTQQGEILGCVLVFRDISERKSAEAERQKLVSLAERSTDFSGE